MNNNSFDLPGVIPLLSALIIVLGIVNLTVYYSAFGIEILSYVSLSEVILSFISVILYPIGLLLVFLCTVILFYDNLFSKLELNQGRKNEISNKLKEERSVWKKLKLQFTLESPFFLASIGFIGSNILVNGTSNQNLLLTLYGLAIFISISFGRIILRIIEENSIYKNLNSSYRTSIQLVVISMILTGLMTLYSKYNIGKERLKRKNMKVSILFTNGNRFCSTNISYVVGQTENYVFIYNEKDSISEVISKSQITRIIYDN